MRILVCFKITPDLEKIVDADWRDFDLSTDIRYAGRVLNCFDESALEIALRLKEQCQAAAVEASCAALTLGSMPPPAIWQTLYAAGYDEVRVLQTEGEEFVPTQVAARLAEVAGEYDLVLTGRQSPMADSASIPYLLGELLGFPVISEAETVTLENGKLSVDCGTDEGRSRLLFAPPSIIAVGNSPVAALRGVTLRSKLQAGKRQVFSTEIALAGKETPPSLSMPQAHGDCEFWTEEDPALLAGRLAAYIGGGEAQ